MLNVFPHPRTYGRQATLDGEAKQQQFAVAKVAHSPELATAKHQIEMSGLRPNCSLGPRPLSWLEEPSPCQTLVGLLPCVGTCCACKATAGLGFAHRFLLLRLQGINDTRSACHMISHDWLPHHMIQDIQAWPRYCLHAFPLLGNGGSFLHVSATCWSMGGNLFDTRERKASPIGFLKTSTMGLSLGFSLSLSLADRRSPIFTLQEGGHSRSTALRLVNDSPRLPAMNFLSVRGEG